MKNAMGIIGAALLAACAAPQAWKSLITQSASDFSLAFLLMWLVGEICLLIDTWRLRWYLTANYLANIVFILIILRYV